MKEIALNRNPKKAVIVNLSSIHELNYQTTVLNAIAGLEPSYPLNLPGHAYDFSSGKYDKIINDYKTGKTNTDQFLSGLIQMANLNFDDKYFTNLNINDPDYLNLKTERKKALLAEAWNSLIQFKNETSCCCFFSCPALACKQKVQKLMDYAQDEKTAVDAIYFISNTNPLNVYKILEYLNTKFPTLINAEVINTILTSPEEISDQNRDIKISCQNKKPEIYLALSYRYRVFKTQQDNQRIDIPTTPDLLGLLCDKFSQSDISPQNLFLISQYGKDLEEARSLGIKCMNANDFYSSSDLKKDDIISEKQPFLI